MLENFLFEPLKSNFENLCCISQDIVMERVAILSYFPVNHAFPIPKHTVYCFTREGTSFTTEFGSSLALIYCFFYVMLK
uniref:Ovule protein n=1 Tax=Strongyloides venezuelensis TaxID=75913 RepID=A0A0K0FBR9_STRVS